MAHECRCAVKTNANKDCIVVTDSIISAPRVVSLTLVYHICNQPYTTNEVLAKCNFAVLLIKV